jgi:hypothetical protein
VRLVRHADSLLFDGAAGPSSRSFRGLPIRSSTHSIWARHLVPTELPDMLEPQPHQPLTDKSTMMAKEKNVCGSTNSGLFRWIQRRDREHLWSGFNP